MTPQDVSSRLASPAPGNAGSDATGRRGPRSPRPELVRSGSRSRRSALSAFVVLVAGSWGCHEPGVVEQYDPHGDERLVFLGPLDLEGLFFGKLELRARLPGHFSPFRAPEEVNATFLYRDFSTVSIRADGVTYQYRRPLFQEHGIIIAARDFARIASAQHVSGWFDKDGARFSLTSEQLLLLKEFARTIRVLDAGETS